ncbi:MAG: DNA repair protein RecO [Hydrogenovibrio sp.]|nr:DNA repair protein RecO [Hydrogenovibrio sp.]
MAREVQQLAYVLHRRPYRETSLLVTFLTAERGKQNAIVRGVRSSSKTARVKQAWLQPFQSLNVSWSEKPNQQSDLVTLRLLEPAKVRFPLMGEANICGLYLNELLYRLLYPTIVSESLFHTYQQTLYDLAKAEGRNRQAWILRQFEFSLLTELGYGFDLEKDSNGVAICPEGRYVFLPEYGFVEQTTPAAGELEADRCIDGRCLVDFLNQTYSEACLPSMKRLFRQVLASHLGDKPIQARALFQH